MDSFSTILKSPYYFGEISEEEAKNILMKEPPHTYLFRRLRNGTITMVMIQEHLGEKELLEMVVKKSYGIKLHLQWLPFANGQSQSYVVNKVTLTGQKPTLKFC